MVGSFLTVVVPLLPGATQVTAAAAEPTTTFAPADACHVYVVPDQVGQIDVELVGGAGFAGGGPGSPGGRGGKVTARLDVEPGQYLYAVVGSAGGGTGREQVGGGARHRGGAGGDALKGYGLWDSIDYGGGGGGATWLSTDNSTCGSSGAAVNGDAVLAVAGGGGGGGSEANGDNGGAGGDAGQPGGQSRYCPPIFGSCSDGNNGGGAGSLHGGGGGGKTGAGGGTYLGWAPTGSGAAALYRNGGRVIGADEFGGAGGGGWFGGGQGGNYLNTYGGGGGGSNYVVPGRTSAGTTPALGVETAGRTPFLSITPVASRKLKVSVDGTGTGAVTSSVGGIDCGSTCAATYDTGAVVTLTATPGDNQRFAGWSGGTCSGTSTTCAVTMDKIRTVKATFNQLRRITWSIDGSSGGGSVTTSPAGYPCGATCRDFDTGTAVTLTATPDASSIFQMWSTGRGDCPGTGPCTITLTDRDLHVYTYFQANVLTVAKQGAGGGSVTATVNGEPCATTDCSGRHPYGTVVVLTHHAEAGSTGQWWSYPCEQNAPTCSITMTRSTHVLANFSKSSRRLDVIKDGSGGGIITSDTPGIACGESCGDRWFNVEQFATVTLSAEGVSGTPSHDSVFTGWAGACSGTGTCTVSLDEARTVRATFTLVARHTLTIPGWHGSGTGLLTTGIEGLDCSAYCQKTFYDGTEVTLTATPDAATSSFDGWTGACNGSGPVCTVTVDQARTTAPTYTLLRRELTVGGSGTGSGTVTSEYVQVGEFPEDVSLDCPGTCVGDYPHGASVLVQPHPAANALFTGWSGACIGTGQCRVTMDQARSLTAEFTRNVRHLEVATTGAGGGTVTGNVLGVGGTDIDCGAVCAADFDRHTSVVLTAVPRTADSRFVKWTGACSTTAVECAVQMSEAVSATAHFELNTLQVSRAGGGTGTVTSSPAGISCGATCDATFPTDTQVVLTATPSPGSTFTGWSAPCNNGGTGTCTVTASGARSVTATFVTTPRVTVTRAGTGAGHGTVTSSTGGISCGELGTGSCAVSLSPGQSIQLHAQATSGSSVRFDHWEGACSGTSTSCVVAPEDAVGVTAVFTRHTRTVTVTTDGTGGGTVASTPAGFSCAADSVCPVELGIDDHLSLAATPDADSTFSGWSGDCAGSGQCNLTDLSEDRAVTATFTAKPTYTLEVRPQGDGHGYVTTDVGDITCDVGETCPTTQQSGTFVWVTAHPGPNTIFDGWPEGNCFDVRASGTECQMYLDRDRTVRAAFRLQTGNLHVSSDTYDTGDGSVTSSPAGIVDCLNCGASFEVTTTVTLTATPAARSTFTKWTPGVCANDDANATGTCDVVVTSHAKYVTASFAHDRITLTGSSTGGSGSGYLRFTGTSPSFDCATTCTISFAYRSGRNVSLVPHPDANMQFVRWDSCSGTVAADSCYLNMFATDQSAVAVFEPIKRAVTTNLQSIGTGASTGRVAFPTTGDVCTEGPCAPTFNQGDPVTLVAEPGPNSLFDSWTGACSGSGATCTLTMNAAKNATARFRGVPRALTIVNDGPGRTYSALNPVNCAQASCDATLDHGTSVTVNATADNHHHFVRWEGACAGQEEVCTFVLDEDRTIRAVYEHDPYELSVGRGGSGVGTVVADVGDIDCGDTCSAMHAAGSTVTLTATPDTASSTFAGWDGACSGTEPTCTLTMDQARGTTAYFDLIPRHLDVELLGDGSGSVSTEPGGVDCGETCEADFGHGTSVTLTARPAAGSSFAGWGAACDGVDDLSCTLELDQARHVTASFDLLPTYALTVTTAGNGSGAVTSDGGPIDCGDTCSAELPSDASVVLVATPEEGSSFAGWSGACTGTETCEVAMTEARDVTASFALIPVESATTLSLSAPSWAYGSPGTATITVAGGEGEVQVKEGATVLATGTLVDGAVTLDLPATLGVGTHTLTAAFPGSAVLLASTSAPQTLTVTRVPSTVALALSSPSWVYGSPGTVTVTVAGGEGEVQVKAGSAVVATGVLNGGRAVIPLPATLGVGQHVLTATYAGTETVQPSTSAPQTLTVTQVASTVGLALSSPSWAYGSPGTVTVTVPGGVGSVQVLAGSTVVATGVLNAGVATIALPATLGVGQHALTASYAGTETVQASTSAPQTLTVTRAAARVTAVLAKPRIKQSARGSLTVTVAAAQVIPSGKVQVKVRSKVIATGTLKSGRIVVKLPKLKKGKHRLVVVYAGSPTVKGGSSKPVVLTVVR